MSWIISNLKEQAKEMLKEGLERDIKEQQDIKDIIIDIEYYNDDTPRLIKSIKVMYKIDDKLIGKINNDFTNMVYGVIDGSDR